jgi:hypothetical protein
MLAAAGAVALALAGGWTALEGGEFWTATGLVLMVVAALLSLTGSNMLSRSGSAGDLAMMGRPPENEDPDSGSGLAPIGVFLFVSVPLFVVGGLLYGSG